MNNYGYYREHQQEIDRKIGEETLKIQLREYKELY